MGTAPEFGRDKIYEPDCRLTTGDQLIAVSPSGRASVQSSAKAARPDAPASRQLNVQEQSVGLAPSDMEGRPVKIDELADPIPVAVFSAGAEVPAAANDGNLVEQASGWVDPLRFAPSG